MSGLGTAFGSGAMTNSINELDDMGPKDAIFAIGTNATECHPIIGLKMLKATERGTKLVVADPRKTDLALHADIWLRLRPGTDVALLNGLSNVILTEGLSDETFIAKRTENFEAFKEVILRFTPEYAASITHISADKIRQAARIIAKADNTALYYTMGITQHTTGVDNVLSTANIMMLTGNLGKPKTGVNPLRGQNNVQGACDMGALPNVYTGYQKVTDPAVKLKFEKAWNTKLSDKVGLSIPKVLNGIAKDEVKLLYVFGENPMRSDPDITHVEHCLKHLDCLIVQDIFLTETAEIADVVLPGVSFAEKDGTFSSTDRTVQRVRTAIQPKGNTLPDWQILRDIMKAMGYEANYNSPEDIFNEMRSLTTSYAGISYKRLEKAGLTWPCPDESHPGTPILHVGKFARGLGKFSPIEYREPAELPDEEYPLMLSTGRNATQYHTGTMTRRSWGLNGANPEGYLEINPKDAEHLNIKDGDEITATTRRGSLITKALVTTRVPIGLTFITFHYTESPANILTNSAADPVAGTPEFKVCSVKVEKLSYADFGCQKRKFIGNKNRGKAQIK